jgi:hypothetical protein
MRNALAPASRRPHRRTDQRKEKIAKILFVSRKDQVTETCDTVRSLIFIKVFNKNRKIVFN